MLSYNDAGKIRESSYIEERAERIAAAATDREAEYLTLLAISGEASIPPEYALSFSARGLVSEGRLTAAGENAISSALFGDGERYPFPGYFPMLAAIIGSGAIPEKESSAARYLSSELFTARFPSIPPENAARIAMKTISSLLYLKVAEKDSDGIYLSPDASRRFMSLPVPDIIGYILHPEMSDSERRVYVKALSVLSLARDGSRERILEAVQAVSGYDISGDLDELETFMFIEKDDGHILGSRMPENAEEATISNDFSILATGSIPELFRYAEPVKLTETSELWSITRGSVKTACYLGLSFEDVRESLERISKYPVPETIYMRISSWFESFASMKAVRGIILAADERRAHIIDSISTISPHIIAKLSPSIFLMNPTTEKLWRKALVNEGFDMLPRTIGPHFSEEPEETRSFEENYVSISLPEKRKIPFSQETRERLLSLSSSPLERLYILSGLIYEEGMGVPPYDSANGLYYQEKLHLIASAASAGTSIYAQMLDGTAYAGVPAREDNEVIIASERLRIEKIWKVCSLAPGVLPMILRPENPEKEDNDIL